MCRAVGPAYRRFHERSGIGDPGALERALAAVWADVEGTPRSDLAALARDAEVLAPGEEDRWNSDMPAAQNAAAAVAYAIRARSSSSIEDPVRAARQVYEALDSWIAMRDDLDPNVRGNEDRIRADPLIRAELARQQRDLDSLQDQSDELVRRSASAMRARAQEESARLTHRQVAT